MARQYGDYLRRGATIAAVVVDSPERNAAMVEKLALPFPVLSDPGGEQAIKPFGVWDEGRNIAITSIVILNPDGEEVFRYVGEDFMDRPDDEVIYGALDELRLPPIEAPTTTIEHLTPVPGPRAMPLPDLAIYMRGVRSATQALAGRARDLQDRADAERTTRMAEHFIAAQAATLRVKNR